MTISGSLPSCRLRGHDSGTETYLRCTVAWFYGECSYGSGTERLSPVVRWSFGRLQAASRLNDPNQSRPAPRGHHLDSVSGATSPRVISIPPTKKRSPACGPRCDDKEGTVDIDGRHYRTDGPRPARVTTTPRPPLGALPASVRAGSGPAQRGPGPPAAAPGCSAKSRS